MSRRSRRRKSHIDRSVTLLVIALLMLTVLIPVGGVFADTEKPDDGAKSATEAAIAEEDERKEEEGPAAIEEEPEQPDDPPEGEASGPGEDGEAPNEAALPETDGTAPEEPGEAPLPETDGTAPETPDEEPVSEMAGADGAAAVQEAAEVEPFVRLSSPAQPGSVHEAGEAFLFSLEYAFGEAEDGYAYSDAAITLTGLPAPSLSDASLASLRAAGGEIEDAYRDGDALVLALRAQAGMSGSLHIPLLFDETAEPRLGYTLRASYGELQPRARGAAGQRLESGGETGLVILGENHKVEFIVEGEVVSTAYYKENASVKEPPAPPVPAGKVSFRGWQIEGTEEFYIFGSPADRDLKLVAAFGDAWLVQFMDADGDTVIDSREYSPGEIVAPTAAAPALTGAQKLTGWQYRENARWTPYVYGVLAATDDIRLYPVIAELHHVHFETEGSPVATRQVENGGTVEEPDEIPERVGHAFRHWSAGKDGGVFDFGTPITAETTLYAVWEAVPVPYTVIYWTEREGIADDAGENPANYEINRSEIRHALSGAVLAYTEAKHPAGSLGADKLDDGRALGALTKELDAYTYFSHGDTAAIAADGSTVINIYFKRIVYTLSFDMRQMGGHDSQNRVHTMEIGGKTYTQNNTTAFDRWYSFETKLGGDVTRTWPDIGTARLRRGSSDTSFVGWYKDIDHSDNHVQISRLRVMPKDLLRNARPVAGNPARRIKIFDARWGGQYIHDLHYWLEIPQSDVADLGAAQLKSTSGRDVKRLAADGGYRYYMDHPDYEQLGIAGTTDFYYAKDIEGYVKPASPGEHGSNEKWLYSSGIKGGIKVYRSDFLYDYKRHTIDFNTLGGSAVSPVTNLLYKTPLAQYEPSPAPTRTANGISLTFTGWYTDADRTMPFDFAAAQMPDENLLLYAGWEEADHTVQFFTRPGETTPLNAVGLARGQALAGEDFPYTVGSFYPGLGTLLRWVYFEDVIPQTFPENQQIYRDYALYGVWKTGGFTLTYDPNNGDGVRADEKAYALGTRARLFGGDWCTPPADMAFIGWNTQRDGGGLMYYAHSTMAIPGDTTLYAQYGSLDEYNIVLIFHANNGQDPEETKRFAVKEGQLVQALDSGAFRNGQMALTGWSLRANGQKLLDPGALAWIARQTEAGGAEILRVENGEVHLYALWDDRRSASVTKQGDDELRLADDSRTIHYTITITNTGAEDIVGFRVLDTLGGDFDPAKWSARVHAESIGGVAAHIHTGDALTIGGDKSFTLDYSSGDRKLRLLPNASLVLSIDLTLQEGEDYSAYDGKIITNKAALQMRGREDIGSDQVNTVLRAEEEPEDQLSLRKTVDRSSLLLTPDAALTYTLTVTNEGDNAVQDYALTDTLTGFDPAFWEVYLDDARVRPEDFSDSSFALPGGPLAPGAQRVYTVKIRPVAANFEALLASFGGLPATVANRALVTPENGPAAQTPDVETEITYESVTVEKRRTPDADSLTLTPDTQITYTLLVQDAGTAAASGYTVTDELKNFDAAYWLVSVDGGAFGDIPQDGKLILSGGAIAGQGNSHTIALRPRAEAYAALREAVRAAENGYRVGNSALSAPQGGAPSDPGDILLELEEASLTKTAYIGDPADGEAVTSENGTITAAPGATIGYRIVARNTGTVTMENPVLRDELPVALNPAHWTVEVYLGGEARSDLYNRQTHTIELRMERLLPGEEVSLTVLLRMREGDDFAAENYDGLTIVNAAAIRWNNREETDEAKPVEIIQPPPGPDQPQEKPDQPQEKPDQPQEKPDQPQEKPDQPQEKPDQPQEKPDQPQEKPDQPQEKPDQPQEKPDQPQEKPDQPQEKPDQPQEKPDQPQEKPDQPQEKPIQPPAEPEQPIQPPAAPQQPLQPPAVPEQPEPTPAPETYISIRKALLEYDETALVSSEFKGQFSVRLLDARMGLLETFPLTANGDAYRIDGLRPGTTYTLHESASEISEAIGYVINGVRIASRTATFTTPEEGGLIEVVLLNRLREGIIWLPERPVPYPPANVPSEPPVNPPSEVPASAPSDPPANLPAEPPANLPAEPPANLTEEPATTLPPAVIPPYAPPSFPPADAPDAPAATRTPAPPDTIAKTGQSLPMVLLTGLLLLTLAIVLLIARSRNRTK